MVMYSDCFGQQDDSDEVGMSLKWDKSLELGFSEIDQQHRSIFERFDDLSKASMQGRGDEILKELSSFLHDYAEQHFACEEKIMVEYNYPAIEVQRREHADFTRYVNEFKTRIEQDQTTRELAIEVTGRLLRWIVQHIRRHDRELVEYIKAHHEPGSVSGQNAVAVADKEYLIGRQPILNRDEEVVAFELLFRSAASRNSASVIDSSQATARVIINTLSGFGIDHILGPHKGFINMDLELLMSDTLHILPKERVVLELLENLQVTTELIERCQALKDEGYVLALDDHEYDPSYEELYRIVEIVKVDLMQTPQCRLKKMVEQFRPYQLKLLAEKVESREDYLHCLDLGFELFQGFYFARPVVLDKKNVDESHVTLLKLMRLIGDDSGLDLIESTFRSSPGLIYKLLMLVNSVSYGLREKIQSVRHAVAILGYRRIKQWVQLALFAANDSRGLENPLLEMAAVRAAFLEHLVTLRPGCLKLPDAPDQAFMVGILSLLDSVYSISIDELLNNLNLSEQIRDALVNRGGMLGELLTLAESMERVDFNSIISHSARIGFSAEDVLSAQVAAYGWRERLQ